MVRCAENFERPAKGFRWKLRQQSTVVSRYLPSRQPITSLTLALNINRKKRQMLFENEKKTANGQQEGRCANAREGGRSIACCWFCIFKEDKPSRFKRSSDIESLISPAADFAFSNKTNHLNSNKQEHPFQLKQSSRFWKFPLKHFVLPRLPCPHFWNGKWFPVVFLLPVCCVFCLSFSTTGVVLLLAGGAVLVGVTSSAATHALAKGGSDLWCNCYTPATRRYIDTNVNVHFFILSQSQV